MYSLLVDSSLRCLSIPHGLLTRGHPTEYKEQLSLRKIGGTRRDRRAVCKCSWKVSGKWSVNSHLEERSNGESVGQRSWGWISDRRCSLGSQTARRGQPAIQSREGQANDRKKRKSNGYMWLRYRGKDCDRIRREVETKEGVAVIQTACESTVGVAHPAPPTKDILFVRDWICDSFSGSIHPRCASLEAPFASSSLPPRILPTLWAILLFLRLHCWSSLFFFVSVRWPDRFVPFCSLGEG